MVDLNTEKISNLEEQYCANAESVTFDKLFVSSRNFPRWNRYFFVSSHNFPYSFLLDMVSICVKLWVVQCLFEILKHYSSAEWTLLPSELTFGWASWECSSQKNWVCTFRGSMKIPPPTHMLTRITKMLLSTFNEKLESCMQAAIIPLNQVYTRVGHQSANFYQPKCILYENVYDTSVHVAVDKPKIT